MKYNIKNVNGALNKLEMLNGVEFTWKNTNLESIGVIAQDVEDVFPELVSTTDGKKTVNYNGLIGVLIEAVKTLNEKIAILESNT